MDTERNTHKPHKFSTHKAAQGSGVAIVGAGYYTRTRSLVPFAKTQMCCAGQYFGVLLNHTKLRVRV